MLRVSDGYTSPWVAAAAQAAADLAAAAAQAQHANQQLEDLLAELANTTRSVERQADKWVLVWAGIEDATERTRVGTQMLERLRSKPAEFHRVTGRVPPAVAHRAPGTPPGYMAEFLELMKPWMDENAPEVSKQ